MIAAELPSATWSPSWVPMDSFDFTFTVHTIPLVSQLKVTSCLAENEPEDSTLVDMNTSCTVPAVSAVLPEDEQTLRIKEVKRSASIDKTVDLTESSIH